MSKLLEKQQIFQSIHKHTYLKRRMDKLTSVAIPLALALAGTSLFLIGRGISITCLMGLERWNEISSHKLYLSS